MNIGLTDKCNLSCFMCCSEHSPEGHRYGAGNPLNQDMSDFVFERTLESLQGVSRVSISGNGEPFLTENIVSRLQRIRAICPTAQIQVTTNGQLLCTERMLRDVLSVVDSLTFSIHGLDSVYEEIMVGASYAQLQENLKLLNAIRPETPGFKDLSLVFVVMRKNYRYIPAMIEFAAAFGFDSVVFSELSMIHDACKAESIRFDSQLEREVRALLDVAMYRGSRYGISVFIDETLSLGEGLGSAPGTVTPHVPCTIPWNEFLVHEDGTVLLCCKRNTYLGRLAEASFNELWYGSEATKYRRGLLTQRYYKECAECKFVNPTIPENFKNCVYFKTTEQ